MNIQQNNEKNLQQLRKINNKHYNIEHRGFKHQL